MASNAFQQDSEAFWKDRLDRTIKLSLPTGRSYTRGDFINHVQSTVGLEALQALGPTSVGHVWEMTFKTANQKTQFLAKGDFKIKDQDCIVSDVRKGRYKVRAHWTPYYVPMITFIEMFRTKGCKVLSASFDKSVVTGCEEVHSLIRTFLVETDQPSSIPHLTNWSFQGMTGQTLLTMTGRQSVCLKCEQPGHIRKNCRTDFCRRCRIFGHKTEGCAVMNFAAASRTIQPEGELVAEDHDDTQMDTSSSMPVLPPTTPTVTLSTVSAREPLHVASTAQQKDTMDPMTFSESEFPALPSNIVPATPRTAGSMRKRKETNSSPASVTDDTKISPVESGTEPKSKSLRRNSVSLGNTSIDIPDRKQTRPTTPQTGRKSTSWSSTSPSTMHDASPSVNNQCT